MRYRVSPWAILGFLKSPVEGNLVHDLPPEKQHSTPRWALADRSSPPELMKLATGGPACFHLLRSDGKEHVTMFIIAGLFRLLSVSPKAIFEHLRGFEILRLD
ncbi:MAG: hypothetical protein CM1200mP29_12010 [Verrucomicrobiota bacterium]|nr:MAG: hypothetical protein CM1200mP29_12010 [Verrucomicrobiota bacterium]